MILSYCESFLIIRLVHTEIGIAVDILEEISKYEYSTFSLVSHKNVTRSFFISALHNWAETNLVENVT